MKLELEGNRERALKLVMEYWDVQERIKKFVGEANCGYDGNGYSELRKIATDGIIEAAKEQENENESN